MIPSPRGVIFLRERLGIYLKDWKVRIGAMLAVAEGVLHEYHEFLIPFIPVWGAAILLVVLGILSCRSKVQDKKAEGE